MKATGLKRIVIVDDEPQILTFLRDLFRLDGWDVRVAGNGTTGIELLERERFDIVLTDLKMPGADGIEVLRTARKIQPDAEIILMTAYGTIDSANEAMRAGAFHYLAKPFRAEEVLHLVNKAYDQRLLKRENRFLKAEFRGEYRLQSIIGTSAAIQETIAAVRRLAETDMPILLSGERGSGREFLARTIHFQSGRSGQLFVPVHCAGLAEDALENDLFGYAAGAYPKALLPRAGKMDLANHGTIYLADIDAAGPRVLDGIQRFLATRTFTPAGSKTPVEVDVRVVASCAPGIDEKVAQEKFPAELRGIFRPGDIRVPALRERPEDIHLFLHHVLFEANRERRKPLKGYSESAIKALVAHPWPGNVRELRELVLHIAAKKKQGSVVDAADIPPEILYRRKRRTLPEEAPVEPVDIKDAITDLEKPMVLQALALADGNLEEAAHLLRIDAEDLGELMRRYDIPGHDGGGRK